ncbi:MAG TPA: baseplate J/gp47 family protein, partial [Pyrinomonadaceae bacterium]
RREEYAVGLYVDGRDRALDLRHGRRVCLLPADGSAGEFRIILSLTSAPAGGASGKFFSLLVELDTPASIAPEWSHEAVADVPPPAQLTWSYRRAGTGERAPFEKVEDGTAGLRRSGVVRLTLPPDWMAEADLPAGEAYAVWVRAERATYSSPPVVKQIVPNVVIARHQRQTDTHELTREWLPLPGNQISLPDLYTEPGGDSPPLQDHPALEDSFELSIRERDGEWHEWTATNALTFHGPDERVFVVERETGMLRFGDGLTGRVPAPGKGIPPENVRLGYRVGGGATGNHGRGLLFEGLTNSAFKARNVVAAEGGEETESLDRARERAAAALRRVERAITASDHEQLLVSAPGVVATLGVALSRAHAELGRHPCHPCRRVPGAITIYVVPDAPRSEEKDDCAFVAAPVPDPGALAAARARVERARLVASEVFVLPAVYREVSLAIHLTGDPVDAVALREKITRRMRDFLDPLVGGAEGTGWGFGEPLRPSALLREAQRAAGEDASVNWVGIGLDGAPPQEKCLDVRIESHELV